MTTRSPARSVPFLAVPLLGLLALLPGAARAADGDPTLQERVAALKQSLAESQKALRTYQWVETTTVSMKGEVKSQKQMSCYYGADGALQKQPLSAPPPPPAKKKGLKEKIVESKKEDLTDAMKKAVALVKSYLPPDPARIQQAKRGPVTLAPWRSPALPSSPVARCAPWTRPPPWGDLRGVPGLQRRARLHGHVR